MTASRRLVRVLAVLVWIAFAAAQGPDVVEVRPGDTLSALARRYDTTVEALKRANALDGDLLRVGQRLLLPRDRAVGYRTVVAGPGATLAAVARDAALTLDTLRSANPGIDPTAPISGVPVIVPPANGATVRVAAGQTLVDVSASAGVSPAEVARLNGLEPPFTLEVGQPLLLPVPASTPDGGASAASPVPEPTGPAAPPDARSGIPPAVTPANTPATASGTASGTTSGTTPTTGVGDAGGTAPEAPVGEAPVPVGPLAASSEQAERVMLAAAQRRALPSALGALRHVSWRATGFAAPIVGRLTSPFGWRTLSVNGNHFHAGVDLAAPWGTEVHAARDGVVLRAGWIGTYGEAVYLDHGDGSQTRYAHLSSVTVRPGQRVRQGDVLGRVGSTGASTGPHLHFELRFDGRAVDPLAYLNDPPTP